MKKVTMIQMEYPEFEKLVQDTYGVKEFSLPADQESGNDTSVTFDADGVLSEYEEKRLQEWLKDQNKIFMADTLINDLVRQGLLEPGAYLVNICW